MLMHLLAPHLNKMECPANRFRLSNLVSLILDPGAETFVDELMTDFYHTTVVTYSKPPEEALRWYAGNFC